MAETSRDLVVVMTHGADHELSSVALTVANGGMTTIPVAGQLPGSCPRYAP